MRVKMDTAPSKRHRCTTSRPNGSTSRRTLRGTKTSPVCSEPWAPFLPPWVMSRGHPSTLGYRPPLSSAPVWVFSLLLCSRGAGDGLTNFRNSSLGGPPKSSRRTLTPHFRTQGPRPLFLSALGRFTRNSGSRRRQLPPSAAPHVGRSRRPERACDNRTVIRARASPPGKGHARTGVARRAGGARAVDPA